MASGTRSDIENGHGCIRESLTTVSPECIAVCLEMFGLAQWGATVSGIQGFNDADASSIVTCPTRSLHYQPQCASSAWLKLRLLLEVINTPFIRNTLYSSTLWTRQSARNNALYHSSDLVSLRLKAVRKNAKIASYVRSLILGLSATGHEKDSQQERSLMNTFMSLYLQISVKIATCSTGRPHRHALGPYIFLLPIPSRTIPACKVSDQTIQRSKTESMVFENWFPVSPFSNRSG